MALRMNEGLSLARFQALYGVPLEDVFSEALEEGISRGWLALSERQLRLTDNGRRLGNWVFELFL